MTPAAALYRPHSVPWLFRAVCFAPPRRTSLGTPLWAL